MRIFLSLILFFSTTAFAVCDFKTDVSKVISLSGSSTVILKELGLLTHKKVQGISLFNPVTDQEYQGKAYPGGIFLSRETLKEFSGAVVFYDEARELRKVLESTESVDGREIKTRNLNPDEAVSETLKVITPYLHQCEDKMASLRQKVKSLMEEILIKLPEGFSAIFYLGEFRNGRAPDMVMANDGVIKWLKEKNKIKTYPSTLAYVSWSAKIISALPKNTLHVGLKDNGREGIKEIKKSSRRMTLIYPGVLVPGISQLEAFLFLIRSL